MFIKELEINNFRSKKYLTLELGKRLTLLVGENGSGKTTVLDAISIGLSAILFYLPDVKGITIKRSDIRETKEGKAPYARVKLVSDNGMEWDRTLRRDKSERTTDNIPNGVGMTLIKRYVDNEILNPLNENRQFQLPLYVYYGVSRALVALPEKQRKISKERQRLEALQNSLNSVSRFSNSYRWFYEKENEEQRKQKELRSFDYKLPELEAVRKAIVAVFPDVADPHITLNPFRFVVRMNDTILDVEQLSDGYKTLLSLVIDLASRMAMANPDMDNPLNTKALVLIDEVDLHLHPEWQRRVVGDLLRTFPQTQFVFTTHSPYIIESVNNHIMRYHINDLEIDDKQIKDKMPLSHTDVEAYYFDKDELINIKDNDVKLIDDKLIDPFNKISELYERMRDIQWEEEAKK